MKNPNRLFLAGLAACCLIFGCESSKPRILERAGTIDVVIDYNGRKQNQEFQIANAPGDSVLAILQKAQRDEQLDFEFRGGGNTAFVTSVGGIQNERAAGDNWTFRVNGQLGERSCGVFGVKAGDRILWLFGKYP